MKTTSNNKKTIKSQKYNTQNCNRHSKTLTSATKEKMKKSDSTLTLSETLMKIPKAMKP